MIRFVADENFNNVILRGVLRQYPQLDIARIQDTDLYGADDPTVLDWVAESGRILLTHDAKTMPKYAYQRLQDGKNLPGMFIVNDASSISQVIEDLLMILLVTEPSEWENRVVYLPL